MCVNTDEPVLGLDKSLPAGEDDDEKKIMSYALEMIVSRLEAVMFTVCLMVMYLWI